MNLYKKRKNALPEGLLADLERYLQENYEGYQSINTISEEKDICLSMSLDEDAPKTFAQSPIKVSGARKMVQFSAPRETAQFSALREMSQRSLDDVVQNLDKSFMEMVFSFADAKGMTDLEVRKKAEIDKRTFSKLKCGTTKTPSKNTALALAIALELNLDETKDLLARAGLALSPCFKTDMIVQYFIEHEAYDIYVINDALDKHGEAPLGSIA